MNRSLVLALAAGCAIATPALAQQQEALLGPLPFGGEVRRDPIGYPSHDVYGSRVIDTVYDCASATFGNGSATHLGTCSQALEDISFAPGPWANPGTHLITEITFGVGVITTPTTTEDILLIFWDKDDVNFQGFGGVGTNMINPAATPLAVMRVDSAGLGAGFYWQLTVSLTGLPGGGVSVPVTDNGIALQIAWVNDGYTPTAYQNLNNPAGGIYAGCASTTDRAICFGSQSGAAQGGNAAAPGSTLINYGRDISDAARCPDIGQFIGAANPPAASGDIENRTIAASPQRGMMVRLRGDVSCSLPTGVTALGSVPDAGLHPTGSVAAGQVNWYSFSIANNADDPTLHFLDIDTEGSTGDVSIALFDSNGSITGGLGIAYDDGSGSGTNDQLTFGVGRRAAVGDGQQYDGRHGQLTAGTYYLAVAPGGSSWGACFTANASTNAGGAYHVNFATNVNAGALATSVAPLINGQDYGTLDPNAATAVPGVGAGTGLYGVLWNKFVLANPADANHFLDLDFGLRSTISADGVAFMFNNSGDLVYFDDDRGGTNGPLLPQFSIGQAGARDYGSGSPPFDGNTPAGASNGLAAGTYYIAEALYPAQDLGETPGLGRRWHVRGTSGSNLNLGADAITGGSGGSNFCCLSDYNGDGDVGTDQDIEDFFSCLGGNCCATCPPDADFNCDGDVGTDADIESFFRVLAGGPC